MKTNDQWVIFETESSGMKRPFYTVEIAAQRMLGFEPDGTPFRVLINHDVAIELQAQAVHGYSQEYLRQHGQEPLLAHKLFREYVGSRPLVSHNLPMDWDRLLVPELQRLGIPAPGVRGFCALTLARRALPETASFSLSALNKKYKLVTGDLRGAGPDVDALVRLFRNWIGPRLTAAGIVGFEAVAEFSRQTPLTKCRKIVEEAIKGWALPAPETIEASPLSPDASLVEFKELVDDIMADGVMTTAEFLILMDWLRDCPHKDLYPINRLQEAVERVSAVDGCVSSADQERLEKALSYYLLTGKAPPRPGETGADSVTGTTAPGA